MTHQKFKQFQQKVINQIISSERYAISKIKSPDERRYEKQKYRDDIKETK